MKQTEFQSISRGADTMSNYADKIRMSVYGSIIDEELSRQIDVLMDNGFTFDEAVANRLLVTRTMIAHCKIQLRILGEMEGQSQYFKANPVK
jgi:hypothetical protein